MERSSEYVTVSNDVVREFKYNGVITDDMRFPTLSVYMNGELINWYKLPFIPTITNESLEIVPYIKRDQNFISKNINSEHDTSRIFSPSSLSSNINNDDEFNKKLLNKKSKK